MVADNDGDLLEALTDFLYLAPVGLMQFQSDGQITLANPMTVQLLMPLNPKGNMTNAYSALNPLMPDIAKRISAARGVEGVLIDHERCEVYAAGHASVISLTIHAVRSNTYLAVFEDVSRLVEQERQIKSDEQRFRAIFDNVRDYEIYTTDAAGRIDQWNQSLQRFGGWLKEDVIGRPFDTFFRTEEPGPGNGDSLMAAARRMGSVETEGWRTRRDGSRLWANTVLTALPNLDGEVKGFVIVSRDMTGRKEMEDELRRLATTDPLTGAFNRRQGHALLNAAFGPGSAGKSNHALLMLDVDHFKLINDSLGHEAGDTALCELVKICQRELGEEASIVRWGGEEFLAILPVKDTESLLAAAEGLRLAVSLAEISVAQTLLRMTISIGVAENLGRGVQEIVRQADAALYKAKRNGRNQVILAAQASQE